MKYQIEFSFHQEYLPNKRCRKERTQIINDSVEVEVKELTKEEFPVAFIVHDCMSVYENAKCYEDFRKGNGEYKQFAEEIRLFDGHLFKVMRVSHGTAVSGKYYEPLSIVSGRLKCSSYGSNKSELPEDAVLLGNDRESYVDSIVEQAKRFVICDGKLWELCGEPIYVISTFGLGNNHGGTALFIQYSFAPETCEYSYNALERELALENARNTALGRGDTEYVDGLGMNEDIEVLIPEVVTQIKRVSELERKNYMFRKLKPHIGHHIVCVSYGDSEEPVDICIECEDCGEVLVSAEDFDGIVG